jgi:hypothetical protein
MTRNEAFAELERRWGKNARCEVGNTLSSPERRQAAADQAQPLEAERDALRARYEDIRRQLTSIDTRRRYHKFVVGFVRNPGAALEMFMVEGKGDTWEEAFADADTKSALKGKAS